MREILFRGKRLDNGEWVYGNLVRYANGDAEIWEIFNPDIYTDCRDWVIIPETVGQYTGLKDKNNKKIFAGDVLYDDHWEVYGIVVFDDGGFRVNICNLSEDLFEFTDCPIAGNKWDNPELLEVE